MTELAFELLSPILREVSIKTAESNEIFIKLNNDLLGEYEKLRSAKNKESFDCILNIITTYHSVSQKIIERNSEDSFLFNPLKFFYIGETLHSFLIANLLDPNGNHGQGNLFLKTFLQILKIEVSEKDNWIVTAEKGRIDLLLKRTNPPQAVIVIENKSNYANDQENQLYRYWFQEIYSPNKNKYGDKTIEMTSNSIFYQIIYLTPADWKLPHANTFLKPIGYDINLPESIPITPKIWIFNKQINEWLTNSINQLHPNNHRLKEYLKQYIELWN